MDLFLKKEMLNTTTLFCPTSSVWTSTVLSLCFTSYRKQMQLAHSVTTPCPKIFLLCYIIQPAYPLCSVRPDIAVFQLTDFLKMNFLHHVQETNQQEQYKIKITSHAIL